MAPRPLLPTVTASVGHSWQTSGGGLYSRGAPLQTFLNPTGSPQNRLLVTDLPILPRKVAPPLAAQRQQPAGPNSPAAEETFAPPPPSHKGRHGPSPQRSGRKQQPADEESASGAGPEGPSLRLPAGGAVPRNMLSGRPVGSGGSVGYVGGYTVKTFVPTVGNGGPETVSLTTDNGLVCALAYRLRRIGSTLTITNLISV